MDVGLHNRSAWNRKVELQNQWTVPINSEAIVNDSMYRRSDGVGRYKDAAEDEQSNGKRNRFFEDEVSHRPFRFFKNVPEGYTRCDTVTLVRLPGNCRNPDEVHLEFQGRL